VALSPDIFDLRDAFAWQDAQRLAARDQNTEALALAREMTAGANGALHWRVFEVQQMTLLGLHKSVLVAAQRIATIRANALAANQRYLICYAQWCGQVALSQVSPGEATPRSLQPDFRDCPLQDVALRWQRAFPLHAHPEWRNRWAGSL
jgi:hypothetical protein